MKIKEKNRLTLLKSLKLKEETKPIEDESNNQSKATIIFNEFINKRKALMTKLYDSVDYNNLKFDYVGMNIKILNNFLMQ